MSRRRQAGLALVLVGIVLLLNPLYIAGLLPYETAGDAFRLTAVYYAQLSLLGLLAIGTGGYVLRREAPLSLRTGAALAFLAVVVHVLLNGIVHWVALATLGVDAYTAFGGGLLNPVSFPGEEGLFVEVVVAGLFSIGLAIDRGSRRERVGVVVAVLIALVVTAALGAGPMAAFGLVIAVTSSDLLGVPGLGLLLLLLTLLLGLAVDRYVYAADA